MNVSQNAAKTALSAIGALLNGGSLVFYSGTMPTSPETDVVSGTNVALATFTFAATAYGTPSYTSPDEGMALAFTATSVNPSTSGTAVFARAFASGATPASSPGVVDFTVGASGSGADIILGNTAIQTGVQMNLSSLTLQAPAL
jgi:hypothetical protein